MDVPTAIIHNRVFIHFALTERCCSLQCWFHRCWDSWRLFSVLSMINCIFKDQLTWHGLLKHVAVSRKIMIFSKNIEWLNTLSSNWPLSVYFSSMYFPTIICSGNSWMCSGFYSKAVPLFCITKTLAEIFKKDIRYFLFILSF